MKYQHNTIVNQMNMNHQEPIQLSLQQQAMYSNEQMDDIVQQLPEERQQRIIVDDKMVH